MLYTDDGSDFTSNHLEQVAADLRMHLMFSLLERPRGRERIKRFFSSLNQFCLSRMPGNIPSGSGATPTPTLDLPDLDARIREFIVATCHARVNSETRTPLLKREALATSLDGVPENEIYSTPHKRACATVEPLARWFQIMVMDRAVSSRNIPLFAREVLAKNGGQTVVIVEYSNTVPELVKAFSSRAVAPIAETEYDRFYLAACPTAATDTASLFQTR